MTTPDYDDADANAMCCQRCSMGTLGDSRKQPGQGGSGLCARPWLLPLLSPIAELRGKGPSDYGWKKLKFSESSKLPFARLERLLTFVQASLYPQVLRNSE